LVVPAVPGPLHAVHGQRGEVGVVHLDRELQFRSLLYEGRPEGLSRRRGVCRPVGQVDPLCWGKWPRARCRFQTPERRPRRASRPLAAGVVAVAVAEPGGRTPAATWTMPNKVDTDGRSGYWRPWTGSGPDDRLRRAGGSPSSEPAACLVPSNVPRTRAVRPAPRATASITLDVPVELNLLRISIVPK
jgi:hypothetical protein